MPRNTYFTQGSTGEQNLYENLLIEAIRIYGQDVYYIPRNIISVDEILNEDIESKFEDAAFMEMYLENLDGFEGDNDFLGKIGLEIRDQATLVVSKRVFERETLNLEDDRPVEGALIYLPLSGGLFEIMFVEHEQPFYQLENIPVYKLTIEKYEYRGEEINTGIEEIDDIENVWTNNTPIRFSYDTASPRFQIGEHLNIGDSSPILGGKIIALDNDTLILEIGQISSDDGNVYVPSDILLTTPIFGTESNASGTVMEVIDIMEDDQFDNDIFDDGEEFETGAESLIDVSKPNPFGEP